VSSSRGPLSLVVGFDDDHAVANAGLLLPATLAERLGIDSGEPLELTALMIGAGRFVCGVVPVEPSLRRERICRWRALSIG
jgi:hypothetical protein